MVRREGRIEVEKLLDVAVGSCLYESTVKTFVLGVGSLEQRGLAYAMLPKYCKS
jgi:hypothetical protein